MLAVVGVVKEQRWSGEVVKRGVAASRIRETKAAM